MKQTATLLIVLILVTVTNSFGQTTYNVKANSSYPANCSNCTFNIEPGVTLTISKAGTCNNCTFNGGNIEVKNTIICQPCSFVGNKISMTDQAINLNSKTTSFDKVTLTANGASSIIANTPVTIRNSTFTFNGTSFFNNNGGQLDVTNSTLNFFDNGYFIANSGPVNLSNASKLVAGNGIIASKAYIKMNGPVLNIIDKASSIVLGNNNNSYFNWNAYNSLSNGKSYATNYPSDASKLNCGGAGQNACGMWSAPTVYGPSAFTASGVAATNSLLPVVLTDFSVKNTNLEWTTAQEMNSAYFLVERSVNGSAWTTAGTVTAKGNSFVTTRYTFTADGPAYYRLAMVDLDGTKTYSATKFVSGSLVKGISFYPNPAIDVVNVSLAGESTVQLLNQSGQVLQEKKSSGNISLSVSQYPRGTYILNVVAANGTAHTSKLMIAR